MAAYAAIDEFRDPGGRERALTRESQAQLHSRRWAYYRNASRAVYTDAYILARGLYRHTRLVYNPLPSIADFYVDNVFDVSRDAVDEGLMSVTALADGVDEKIKIAVAQLEQWGNWQSESPRVVRFGAVAGSVFVKIVDELEREKVTEQIFWPSMVKEKVLDGQGNVKSYVLEYKVWDEPGRTEYTYREEADGEVVRFFRDGKPYVYDEEKGAVWKHPYTFCPAVWITHENDGWDDGTPAVSDTTKIDEINSITSHARDHGHKAIEAGKLLSTNGEMKPVTGAVEVRDASGKPTGRIARGGYDPRFDWTLLKAPEGSAIHDLGSSYDLGQIDPEIKRELDSFERDYPELQVHDIIKNKAQIAGVALERMLAPAQKKLDRAAARYHHQIVKLRQMQIAIAGWRTSNGWTKRDRQQERFRPFGLDSYTKGGLDFGFKRSQLIQSTPLEEEELKAKKAERANALKDRVTDKEYLIIAGYAEENVAEVMRPKSETPPPVVPGQPNGESAVVN